MAQSSQKGGYAFLKDAFGLPVAVLCSEDASLICKKNELTFVELLRPFCRLTTEVRIRDQLGHQYKMTDLRVSLSEPQLEPISDSKHRLLLGQTVRQTEGTIDMEMSNRSFGNIEIAIGGLTPWYENYRDDFVQLMKQSHHEYIRHYMGSLLVVSSSNEDPVAAFTELYQQQKKMESLSYPKWMTPHVYCWHVLLHDVVAGNARRAGDLFDRIKGQYGAASCYLLQINSRPSSSASTESLPDPWSQFLRHQRYTEDIDTPSRRSQMTKQLHHRESVDGKQEATSPTTPNGSNNTDKDALNKVMLKPDDVREEATLTSCDEPDSSPVISSLSSTNIQLGSDPLSSTPMQLERKVRSAQSSPYMKHTDQPVETRTNISKSLTALEGQQQQEHNQPSKVVRYGVHLTLEDHNRLQRFLEEFVTRGLLPHLEQLTRTMNERLASRQGLRRTLISATRKWLGGGRQLNNISPGTHNAISSSLGYAHDSPELQMRQLGDLAFLLQNYELSYQTYNSVRKDYQVDHAWLLYAGAVEMTALSLFMMGSNKKELSPYFEDALAVYRSNTKNMSLILRCMLLHCEVLKSRSLYREAANAFLKMSNEDNDLLCALCMEQAAQCFLKHSMRRKYCFHMILAGHHYSKTAQRMHSARAYMQALQIIKSKSWTLAEDYVNFSLARHAFSLKRLVEAKLAFEKLFVHKSTQLTIQQETNIKEYIFIHKQLLDQLNMKQMLRLNEKHTSLTSQANTDHLPILPLPSINVAKTRVIFGVDKWTQVQLSHEAKQNLTASREKLSVAPSPAGSRDSSPLVPRKNASSLSALWLYSSGACEVGRPRQRWEGLEGVAAAAAGTRKQLSHKQLLYLDHTTDNTNTACVVTNETIAVELQLANLLNVRLNLSGVCLIWEMEQKQDNHTEAAVSCEVISEFLLPPSELKTLCLHITPLCEGNLHVSGILFNLGVDASSDLPPNSPLQSVMHSGSQFRLASSAKDSVFHQTRPDLESYLAEGIQGRIPLSIVGRRVHKTQTKPYSIVQEKDYRLSWQVVPAMPKLLVGMCGFPMSLLAGEISRVLLEVENFGQEPLNNLRLASSHHHLLLLEKDIAVTKNTIYSTSIAEQTSNSLHTSVEMKTLSQYKDFPLPDGQLSPGQKQQLSMLVQAPSHSGHHTVDMLYYYEPLQVTSKLDHRVVEHSCKLMVKDSLNITYTQCSSYQPLYDAHGAFNLDKFVISLEIENRCQVTSDHTSVREIRILQVTCASTDWTIQRCSKQQHGIISLVAGMAALLHLKVVRATEGGNDHTLLLSDVALGQAKVLTDKSPVCDLFFGSELCRKIVSTSSSTSSQDGWSDNKTMANTSTNNSYLALIVFWQALLPSSQGTKFSYGQQYVLVPIPQPHQEPQRMLPNTSSGSVYLESSEWIRFSLQHPVHHPHDFSLKRVCVVPVKLLLHNCSYQDLDVLIDFSPQDTNTSRMGGSSANKLNSSHRLTQEFCWSGVCRRRLSMPKHATTTIDIQACFSHPGTYNLTNFGISASTNSKINRYQAQKWTTPSMIIIG